MLISFAMICSCQNKIQPLNTTCSTENGSGRTRTALIERLNALDEKVNALDKK